MLTNFYNARPWRSRSATLLVVFTVLVLPCGCDIPDRPPIGVGSQARTTRVETPLPTEQVVEPPQASFDHDWETWNIYYLNGKPIGYSHLSAEALLGNAIRQGTDANVQYTLEDQIRMRRGNAGYLQHFKQTSTETAVGVLLDFESTLHVGPLVKHFRGVVEEEDLNIETVDGRIRSTRTIEWQSTNRGLVGVQQSLRRKPMIVGERRLLKTLSPVDYSMMSVEMNCRGRAAVPLIDGEYQELIEILVHYVAGPETIVEQTVWTDSKGEIHKTLRTVDGLTSLRATKEAALKVAVPVQDVLKETKVEVKGDLERPQEATRVAYELRPRDGAKDLISVDAFPGQYVRKGNDSVQVLVNRRDTDRPAGFESQSLAVDAQDSAVSRLIDFKARHLSQLATAVGKSEPGQERRLAIDLTSTVHNLMTPGTVARGLITASEISNMPEGGCLEHAIFLAAMLRARQIPARLAVGLVYQPGEPASMRLHVWNLAFVDDRWLALDAMSGKVAAADRITLATTNLSEANEYSALKEAMDALGRFTIEIRGVEY